MPLHFTHLVLSKLVNVRRRDKTVGIFLIEVVILCNEKKGSKPCHIKAKETSVIATWIRPKYLFAGWFPPEDSFILLPRQLFFAIPWSLLSISEMNARPAKFVSNSMRSSVLTISISDIIATAIAEINFNTFGTHTYLIPALSILRAWLIVCVETYESLIFANTLTNSNLPIKPNWKVERRRIPPAFALMNEDCYGEEHLNNPD